MLLAIDIATLDKATEFRSRFSNVLRLLLVRFAQKVKVMILL